MLSLCITLKNENVESFIQMLALQTKWPDETIIVDASAKNWKNPLKNAILKKLNIHYLSYESTRGEGRNKAVQLAAHENLMFLDGGCDLDRNAIREMTASLNQKDSEIIAGRYLSTPRNFHEYVFSLFLNIDLLNKDFYYPSARIFGIKKKIFLKIGGFKAKLKTAEDTEFFKRAISKKFNIVNCAKCVVEWQLPSFRNYFAKILNYARGDAQSEIWWDEKKKFATHNLKHLLALTRWCLLIGLLYLGFYRTSGFLLIVYLYAVGVKHGIDFRKFSNNNFFTVLKNVLLYAIIKIGTDFAAISGFLLGFF
jgi:hypothetical protein